MKVAQERKARVNDSIADATKSYEQYKSSTLNGPVDYDDLMEHFDVMSVLGVDTNSTILDLGINGRSDIVGYEPVPFNQDLAEYSTYLQDQLESDFPAVASMSQAEFLVLLTAAIREQYDETGNPYWTADLDIPIPSGYTSITVRISEV
jgi:hypothetical protein